MNDIFTSTYNGKTYMRLVSKTRGNFLCIIDFDTIALVQTRKWSIGMRYVHSAPKGEHKAVYLHRFLLNPTLGEVDHINGDKLDNRLANLREVTRQNNSWNKKKTRGTSFSLRHGRWRACIATNRKQQFLGYFDTEEEAHLAYLKAKALLHPGSPINDTAWLAQKESK